ncbi:hypothetical protein D3C72_186430 [compost metagenome]
MLIWPIFKDVSHSQWFCYLVLARRKGGRHASIRPIVRRNPCIRAVFAPDTYLKQNIHSKSDHLAKPNFQYEKRQKELEKKRKKEEKLKRKLEKGNAPDDGTEATDDADEADTEAADDSNTAGTPEK